jgi:hypothetical protein
LRALVNWNGLPAVIPGTTDRDRVFHPFGIAVMNGESAEDFACLFRGLKQAIERETYEAYNPKYLVSDNADAIHNGFLDTFGIEDKKWIQCWAHVIR